MSTARIVKERTTGRHEVSTRDDWKSQTSNHHWSAGKSKFVPRTTHAFRLATRSGRSFVAATASPRINAESSFLAPQGKKNLRSFLGLVLLFATAIPLTGCQTPTHAEAKVQAEQRWSEVRGQVKLQLARQQFTRGHFEDAIKTLDEAITLDTKSAEAYALLAKANLELGKPSTAGQILAIAAKSGCVSAELHYIQGVVLEQRDDLGGALAEFEKACTLDPNQATYLLARVETLVALDRQAEALALVDANARKFDDNAALTLLGARIAMMQGNLDSALERFQDPAARNADSQMATEELGALLAQKGLHREVIRLLADRCKDDQPCRLSASGQRTLAESLLFSGDAEAALRILSLPPIAESSDPGVKRITAKAAIATGQYMQALEAIEAARNGKTPDPELELLLATANWKRGDLPGAEAILDRVLSATPHDMEAWCLLGEVLNDAGRTAEALVAMERGLELDPDSRWASDRVRQMRAGLEQKQSHQKKF